MQRTPAGLPLGMPGIGDEIEGAMQHAAQRGRQSMRPMLSRPSARTMGGDTDPLDNENHSQHGVAMAKSAAFGLLHLCIAFSVGYALTGSVAAAGAITLVEPVVNTVAHFVFDRWWESRTRRRLGNAAS
jgi:uncharacterized membrane protein